MNVSMISSISTSWNQPSVLSDLTNALKVEEEGSVSSLLGNYLKRRNKCMLDDDNSNNSNHTPEMETDQKVKERVVAEGKTEKGQKTKEETVAEGNPVKITRKELKEKANCATKVELTDLLNTIYHDSPKAARAFEMFAPMRSPCTSKESRSDPIFQQCFHCKKEEEKDEIELHDFYGVKSCTFCFDSLNIPNCLTVEEAKKVKLNFQQIMDYFHLTARDFPKMTKNIQSRDWAFVQYHIKKKYGSLYSMVAKNQGKTPPTLGQLLASPNAKADNAKRIIFSNTFQQATEGELRSLLNTVAKSASSEIMTDNGLVANFSPRKFPIKPMENDPILKKCFLCNVNNGLLPYHGVKICQSCHHLRKRNTLTKNQVLLSFYLNKVDTDKIPRMIRTGGFFKSKIYLYKMSDVVQGAENKWGSLYNMKRKTSGTGVHLVN